MWKIIGEICLGIFLIYFSIIDFKTRKISIHILILFSVMMLIFGTSVFYKNLTGHIEGLAVGIIFFFISYFTKEAIGYADSWIICIIGFCVGLWNVLWILSAMWLILIPASMWSLFKRKFSRKVKLPMIPFLTAGYFMFLLFEAV